MNKNKKGFVLWLTGLSASGKSTIADRVYEILQAMELKIERLDGDVVRRNLSNLGFSKEDRDANIKRVGFVANLLARNGVNVIASFITPYQKQREELRKNVQGYIEVFVNAPLEICEERDPKGLYKKARNGEIKLFTGIDDPYEKPFAPEIELKTDCENAGESTEKVLEYLKSKKYL